MRGQPSVWRAVVLLLLLLALVGGACGAEEPARDFTDETRDGFLDACTRQLDDTRLTTSICQCVFDGSQRRFSFEEFVAIEDDLLGDRGAPLPDEVVEILAGCIVDEAELNTG